MNKNIKQILAIIAIVLLAGLYLCAFVSAFFKSELAQTLFRAALGGTIIIPVFLYAFLLAAKALKPGKSPLIDTIVFDVGNVLIGFDYLTFCREELGFSEEIITLMTTDHRFSDLWRDFDLGLRPYEEIRDDYLRTFPSYQTEIAAFLDNIDRAMVPYGYAVPMLEALKQRGYRLYILSNWNRFTYDRLSERGDMAIEALTDGAAWSHQTHLLKPDPAAYAYLTAAFGITPERAVFIDDMAANTAAAAEAGYQTITFTDYQTTKDKLAALGVRF